MQTVLVANPSADLYGSDRMVLEAIRGFVHRGDRVVVTCSTYGPLVPELTSLGVRVLILPVPTLRKAILSPRGMLRFFRDILLIAPRMKRLIDRVDPDVVVANTLTIPLWTVAARLSRKPVAVYVHEAEASLSLLARTLLALPLTMASLVIFNSQTSRVVNENRPLRRRGVTRVVLNGVPGPTSVRAARREIVGPLRICYVGRISARKGVDLLLLAVARLRVQGVECRAVIVGDVFPGYEWFEEQLRVQVEESGLADLIQFTGFRAPVWRELAESDLVVVPSRADESLGKR